MDTTMRVWDLAHGRSGDKGDVCNVGVVAWDSDGYEVLRTQLTAERVKEHFGALVTGQVDRYEMPNILALNFVLNGGLNGGGTQSLRSDALGQGHVRLAAADGDRRRTGRPGQSHRPEIAVPLR